MKLPLQCADHARRSPNRNKVRYVPQPAGRWPRPRLRTGLSAGAIEIETVPLAQIYAEHMENGIGPDMPSPNISIPSTKITLPKGMDIEAFTKVDRKRLFDHPIDGG